ncbi:MAG TPA: ABC transporter permease [Candidatus Limnocylindrales bacterium]|nr:ABC transporter permease [Candidatus Limnocylindrales bacterium]
MTGPRASAGSPLAPVAALVGAAVIFVVAWQAVVVAFGLQVFVLPPPADVARRFVTAWTDGTIEPHVAATLVEIALGFAVGAGAGLAVGWLLARSRVAGLVLSPYLVAAQSTPVLALAPVLTVWFGTGLLPKVLICALIVFFPVAVSTMVGFRSVDRRLLELAASLRANGRQRFATIELPAALPAVLGGIRVGVTLAVVGAIVAEWAGPDKGLGALILIAQRSLFDVPLMFATLATIALLGIVLYGAVVLVERQLVGERG